MREPVLYLLGVHCAVHVIPVRHDAPPLEPVALLLDGALRCPRERWDGGLLRLACVRARACARC